MGRLFIEAMACLIPLYPFWFFRRYKKFLCTFLPYMGIIRGELKENQGWGKIRDMGDRIDLGHLTDKRGSDLSLQLWKIQIPVREARRCRHNHVVSRSLIQASGEHAIHPAEVMTDIGKTSGIQIRLRQKQIHHTADIYNLLN